MGLMVDQVTDVIEFEYKSIKSVPDLGIKYNPEFLKGFIEQWEIHHGIEYRPGAQRPGIGRSNLGNLLKIS